MAGKVDTNKSSTTRNFIRSIYPRTFTETFTGELAGTEQDYSALMSCVLVLLYGWPSIVPSKEGDMTNDTSFQM
jgi:hypothetical protein